MGQQLMPHHSPRRRRSTFPMKGSLPLCGVRCDWESIGRVMGPSSRALEARMGALPGPHLLSLVCIDMLTLSFLHWAGSYCSFRGLSTSLKLFPRATTVRYKGRNLRIKAPMCRALKKLCDPDGM